jgi:hypothetical protein
MSLTERNQTAAEADADASPVSGIESYRIVSPMDRTGRMTVEAPGGATYTVVGSLDERISKRLRDRAPGATARMELSPAPSETGYVVARVKAGGLPAL